MFQWGEWWYLVYSEFSDAFQTRYRIAAGPDGPWLAPGRDSVDGRARYASKSVAQETADSSSDGSRRAQATATTATGNGPANWPCSRQPRRPTAPWGSGCLPNLWQASPSQKRSSWCRLTEQPPNPAGARPDRFAAWLGPTLPDPCLVTATLDIASGNAKCGLLLRTDDTAEAGYELRLEPGRNRVVFDRWPRGHTGPAQWQARGDVPYAVELERPCPLPPGRHTVQVLIDGSVCVAVVDNRVALSTRLYDHRQVASAYSPVTARSTSPSCASHYAPKTRRTIFPRTHPRPRRVLSVTLPA